MTTEHYASLLKAIGLTSPNVPESFEPKFRPTQDPKYRPIVSIRQNKLHDAYFVNLHVQIPGDVPIDLTTFDLTSRHVAVKLAQSIAEATNAILQ